ncbi:MAG: hypothetical protein JRJ84_15520, partial [Deltaproteobacteria bacterium]|nr:hypothetical protein [Deltaproteobacteria bacterium]
ALRSVFSDRPVAFHGVKQAIGHTLGATGAIEATVVVDALGSGHHPPHPQHIAETLGLEVPDAAGPPTIALSTNSAFGGANASVVLARPGAVAPRKQSPRPVGTVEGPEVRVPPGRVDWKALWPDAPERFLRFDRYVRLGMLALARLFEKVPPTLETGIVLASPSGCRAMDLRYHERLVRLGAAMASRRDFIYTVPGGPAAEASIHWDLRGPFLILVGPGEQALEEAARLVRWGRATRLVALDVEAPTPDIEARAKATLVHKREQ